MIVPDVCGEEEGGRVIEGVCGDVGDVACWDSPLEDKTMTSPVLKPSLSILC